MHAQARPSGTAHLQLLYLNVSPLQLQSTEAFVEPVHEGTLGDRVDGEGTQESRAPFLLGVPILGQFEGAILLPLEGPIRQSMLHIEAVTPTAPTALLSIHTYHCCYFRMTEMQGSPASTPSSNAHILETRKRTDNRILFPQEPHCSMRIQSEKNLPDGLLLGCSTFSRAVEGPLGFPLWGWPTLEHFHIVLNCDAHQMWKTGVGVGLVSLGTFLALGVPKDTHF